MYKALQKKGDRCWREILRSGIFLFVLFLFTGCGGRDKAGRKVQVYEGLPDSLRTVVELRKAISDCVVRHDYKRSLQLGMTLQDIGKATEDPSAYLSGIVNMGQSFLCLGQIDSMRIYLDKALELGKRLQDNWALATIYNVLGVYALFTEMDYPKGIEYFAEGIKYAELSGDESRLVPLKSNLSLAYYLHNDPAGLPYALDVYEHGKKHGDQYMIYSGAMSSSYMYYLLGDFGQALKYIEIALPLVNTYGDREGAYSLYGDVLLKLGKETEAVHYYKKALAEENSRDYYSGIDAYLSYGTYLMDKKQYRDAIGILKKGLQNTGSNQNPVKRYLLYKNISLAYENLDELPESLKYYKLFHQEADSIFNVDKERTIGNLKLKYQKERYENEIQHHKLKLLSSQKKLYVTVLLLIILILLIAGGYVMYHRKEKYYKQMLKQHQDSLDKQRWYKQELERHTGGKEVKTDFINNRTDDRREELFNRLQELMCDQELYKTPDLSRNRVAKRLSTNRTYLTDVINNFTGLSFTYYVNSFRIDQAVKILSDPQNDTPIKAVAAEVGFHTLSTFYKFFVAAKGVTPSQFRKQIKPNTEVV